MLKRKIFFILLISNQILTMQKANKTLFSKPNFIQSNIYQSNENFHKLCFNEHNKVINIYEKISTAEKKGDFDLYAFLTGTDKDFNNRENTKHLIIDNFNLKLEIRSKITHETLYRFTHHDKIEIAKFNNSGNKIISMSKDGTTYIWDSNSGKLLKTLLFKDKNPICVDLAFNDTVLVFALGENLNFYDLETEDLLLTLKFLEPVSHFKINLDNSLLAVSSGQQIFIYKNHNNKKSFKIKN